MEQQRGQQWLEEVLRLMGIPARVKASYAEEAQSPAFWLTIDETQLTPKQMEALMGSQAEPLDAVQYLANITLNLGLEPDSQSAFTIELNGYRLRRQQELCTLAEEVAQQVRKTGEESQIKSLSSAERRQMHNLLKEYRDLETYSQGQEPNRHLTVRLRA